MDLNNDNNVYLNKKKLSTEKTPLVTSININLFCIYANTIGLSNYIKFDFNFEYY